MGGDDAPDGVDASVDGTTIGPEWTMLIERSWSLGVAAEAQRCRRIQIPEDMYITGFRVVAPEGTHHTLVSLSPNGTQMGDYDCFAQNLDPALLFAGGKGSDDVLFPSGVAIKLAKGSFITLNLHLFNAGDEALTDTSGVYVKRVAASEVVHEADMMFAGTTDIQIPGNNVPHSVIGGCTAPMTWNVFTIWPHMHAYAMRQQVRVRRMAGSTESLLDAAYVFDEQRNYPMSAVRQVNAGDEIEVECTYQNDTGIPVFYGDSALQEMCFAGMYKYPKGGQAPGCIEMP